MWFFRWFISFFVKDFRDVVAKAILLSDLGGQEK
jgi:hypothetical protein